MTPVDTQPTPSVQPAAATPVQTAPTPPPPQPTTPPVQATPSPAPVSEPHGTSPMLIIVGITLLVVAVVGGIYLYSKYLATQTPQKKVSIVQPQKEQPTPQPTIGPSSSLGSTSTADIQLNNDIETVSKSLDNVDNDLNNIDSGLADKAVDLQ